MTRWMPIVACAAALCLNAAAAPILIFNNATGSDTVNLDQNVGWQFDVLTGLTVTGLGWFDDGQDGLDVDREVGIWDPTGVLLASVVVPAGTLATLDGPYRMVPIAPLLLAVGDGYIIGGLNTVSLDRMVFDITQTVDGRIRFVDATFSDFTTFFDRPTEFSAADTGFYGPMFAAAEVPEPGSGLLLLSGVVAMAVRRAARYRSPHR